MDTIEIIEEARSHLPPADGSMFECLVPLQKPIKLIPIENIEPSCETTYWEVRFRLVRNRKYDYSWQYVSIDGKRFLEPQSKDTAADIRNKLGNVTALMGLVALLFEDSKQLKDYSMGKLKGQLEKAKDSINYIKKI